MIAIGYGAVTTVVLLFLSLLQAWGQQPRWEPPMYPMPSNIVLLSDKGVYANQDVDVSAGINAALASLSPGQTLYLAAGLYKIGSPLRIHSETSIQGPQSSTHMPLATFEQIKPFPRWKGDSIGLLLNSDFAAVDIVDVNIKVIAVSFYDDSAGVMIRRAKNIVVEGASFRGGGDGTAFIGSKNTLVSYCLVDGTRNAAYDHWEGPENAEVVNSMAFVARGHGILFNAAGSKLEPYVAKTFLASENIIMGIGNDAVGIWVSPLGNGGSRISGTITILDNVVHDTQAGVSAAGIIVNASGADVVVRGNTISGFSGYPPLEVGPNRPQEGNSTQLPHHIIVTQNVVEYNEVSKTSGAAIKATGLTIDASTNQLKDNIFTDGSNASFMIASGLTCKNTNSKIRDLVVSSCR